MMADNAGATLLEKKDEPPKTPDKKKTKYDVIIIGAGPAGYTAGIYCSRARHDTLILSGILPGGQLVNTTDVENYPGFENGIMGPDLMITMRNQTKRMGTTIVDDEVVNVDFRNQPLKVLTASEEYEAKAVIIATGATPKKLGLEGESTFAGKGVSYCATCDGPFFRNLELVVAGGGDSAMEEATFLTKFASAFDKSKIKYHLKSEVEEIKGNEKVQQVVLKNNKTNQKEIVDVGGVFVAIGHEPNTKLFVNQIEMDDQGYIVLKNRTETNIPGVFAAGDVHDHRYRQAITAAGYGCMAAIDVDRYFTENK